MQEEVSIPSRVSQRGENYFVTVKNVLKLSNVLTMSHQNSEAYISVFLLYSNNVKLTSFTEWKGKENEY